MTLLLVTIFITFVCFIICLAFYSINYGKYSQCSYDKATHLAGSIFFLVLSIIFGLSTFILTFPTFDYIINF